MIIAIVNQKGGVAKTTSTIAIGAELAKTANCLVVDLDPQGNLTTGLGIEIADGQPTLYDVLLKDKSVSDVVVPFSKGLGLLPADIELAKGERELIADIGAHVVLKSKLDEVRSQYSHILIDCPPSLGILTYSALTAADYVIVPVQCQYFALKGLQALLETVGVAQKRSNPKLKILGVLPTMAEKTVMTQDTLANLNNLTAARGYENVQVFPPVPKSIKFAESNLAGVPISEYTKDKKLGQPYQVVAKFLADYEEIAR